MAKFSYQATNAQGKIISGQVEALDRSSAVKVLKEQNLTVSFVKSAKKDTSITLFKGKVKSDELVVFTRELSAMVGAGVPLLRALSSLQDHADKPALKEVLAAISHDVEAGSTLGDALDKHKQVFSSVYVNMVRAGEAAGILDDILKRLALQQEKNSAMRKKIKSAMTYPMVLVFITVLAFFGLMLFVIPQIGKIIKDLGGEDAQLPALTEVMLSISDFIVTYPYIIFPAIIGIVFGIVRFIKTPKGKRIFHNLILKLPGIKTIVIKVAVARFARTFSALMGAGVSVLEALEVTAHAVGNVVFEDIILSSIDQVKNGKNLSSIIENEPLFPPIVSQMLSVGEETGQTDTVLVKVADFYEEEVDVAIDGISSIIEPVMIVFMGGMVGLIAASVMLPIANISNNIKG